MGRLIEKMMKTRITTEDSRVAVARSVTGQR
jgi:hypothetical protein